MVIIADTKILPGKVIRKLRFEKGWTLGKLSGTGTQQQICTERYLRNIEKGISEPGSHILGQLLAALGTSYAQFVHMQHDKEKALFIRELEEIRCLIFDMDHEEAGVRLNSLSKSVIYDINDPAIKQTLLLLEAISLKELSSDYFGSLEKLYSALMITCPKLINRRSKRHAENTLYFSNISVLSFDEYRILLLVASVERALNNLDKVIGLLKSMLSCLESNDIDNETRKKLLPVIHFNLSDTLLEASRCFEALLVCEQGIEFCIKASFFKMIGELYLNEGKAHHNMDAKDKALEKFRLAYFTFRSHGDNKAADWLKATTMEEYGISFE